MCDTDYGQLLEEYRGLVEGLFAVLLDRLTNVERELFRYRYEKEQAEQLRQMEDMVSMTKL